MTQDNYEYRTNPFFLRNQFEVIGKYGIPVVPKTQFTNDDFDGLRLIGFDKIKSDQGKHANRMVHFFLYDYKFECVWAEPDKDVECLFPYRAVLTPDFSMYTEMPDALLLHNIFRNRWCGAYFASQGLRVIPTVNFGLESSYDFCFEGIEKGSVVAVSTYMVQEKEGRKAQKDFFMAGYNEMLRRIDPEKIICYHEPFPEMAGDIVYVNYDLSSWRHMEDDLADNNSAKNNDSASNVHRVVKYGGYVVGNETGLVGAGHHIVKRTGYVVQLGAGSAYGGDWKPKKPEDERYLGKPGEIIHSKPGQYVIETKIGPDGRAVMERHYTSSPNPKYHSNPHDHVITWSPSGNPIPGKQINYWDGNVPVFKTMEGIYSMSRIIEPNSPEDNAFKSIADFQDCMRHGGEVVFIYNGKEYGLFSNVLSFSESDYEICISEIGNDESEAWYDNSNDLLDYIIEDKKLREIITEVTVTDRTI